MINKISDVKIKGEYFIDPITWNFKSNNKKDRLFLIYGPNGSGKTTFSKSIYEYKNSTDGTMKNFEEVDFLDDNNNVLLLDKSHIWSFNDEFIQSNVRLKKSGINAIVMFGEAADIDTKVEELQKNREEFKKKIEEINIPKYEEPKNANNINDAFQAVLFALKGEWALNDRDIKGNTQASRVNESVLNNILETSKPKDTLVKLKKDFEEKLKLYRSLPKDKSYINQHISLNLSNIDEERIVFLLSKFINKPIIDDLGTKIIKELDNSNEFVSIDKTKKVIDSFDVCPVCFQKITQDHKIHLISAINNIFNQEAQEHIEELKISLLKEIDRIDFGPFTAVIDSSTQNEINKTIDEINQLVNEYNLQINKKIQNVFSPIEIENKKINDKIDKLNQIIKNINSRIDEYNNNVKHIKDIKDSLFVINNQIAQLNIYNLYEKYSKLITNRNVDNEAVLKLNEKIENITNEIKILNAKKKNLDLGLKEINDDLMMIFHSRKKLQLELDNGMYYVKSGGRRVQFNDLSVGEKNIIGLCYFFSLLRNEHSKSNVFNDDLFIVLDDPISSFDYNNKYGIYSFIKRMTREILEKNDESKVIILTHELETMMTLDKIRADLECSRKIRQIKNKNLENCELTDSIYVNMLDDVIDAVSNPIIPSEKINTTRRIIEAFSAFVYRKKLTDFAKDNDIFSLIENDKIRSYLNSAAYRFVLNAESHMEDMTKAIPENLCYDTWSDDDKRQTIKDVCVLIYGLNSLHLSKILTNERYLIVENWYKELESSL